MEVKNYFVNIANGENILVYTYELSAQEVKQWVEKSTGEDVTDIYHVPQDQLQYYCIDGRVWADTSEQVAKVRKYLAAA